MFPDLCSMRRVPFAGSLFTFTLISLMVMGVMMFLTHGVVISLFRDSGGQVIWVVLPIPTTSFMLSLSVFVLLFLLLSLPPQSLHSGVDTGTTVTHAWVWRSSRTRSKG